jgi:hypothetical protein
METFTSIYKLRKFKKDIILCDAIDEDYSAFFCKNQFLPGISYSIFFILTSFNGIKFNDAKAKKHYQTPCK